MYGAVHLFMRVYLFSTSIRDPSRGGAAGGFSWVAHNRQVAHNGHFPFLCADNTGYVSVMRIAGSCNGQRQLQRVPDQPTVDRSQGRSGTGSAGIARVPVDLTRR